MYILSATSNITGLTFEITFKTIRDIFAAQSELKKIDKDDPYFETFTFSAVYTQPIVTKVNKRQRTVTVGLDRSLLETPKKRRGRPPMSTTTPKRRGRPPLKKNCGWDNYFGDDLILKRKLRGR